MPISIQNNRAAVATPAHRTRLQLILEHGDPVRAEFYSRGDIDLFNGSGGNTRRAVALAHLHPQLTLDDTADRGDLENLIEHVLVPFGPGDGTIDRVDGRGHRKAPEADAAARAGGDSRLAPSLRSPPVAIEPPREYAESRLREAGHLRGFGSEAVHIPFHGSRGIKFVLRHNDKERGTRDLMDKHRLSAGDILFSGNELVEGGNDNVIRRVRGVTLVSVGHRTDEGAI